MMRIPCRFSQEIFDLVVIERGHDQSVVILEVWMNFHFSLVLLLDIDVILWQLVLLTLNLHLLVIRFRLFLLALNIIRLIVNWLLLHLSIRILLLLF